MKTTKKKAIAKKSAPKKSSKKPKVKAKKKILAVAAPEQSFTVEVEVAQKDNAGAITGYTYTQLTKVITETEARAQMQDLKLTGVGGRLIHLDGTPQGNVVERWGSAGRLVDAEKTETQALNQQQQKPA
jgi:hypothetical protein